jgi:hypothetical protein
MSKFVRKIIRLAKPRAMSRLTKPRTLSRLGGAPSAPRLGVPRSPADDGVIERRIQHTVRYTELAPDRFKNFWR